MINLIKVLESHYCKLTLFVSMVLGYFLVPSQVWLSNYFYFGFIFILVFSLTVTCLIRNIKEKIVLNKTKISSLTSFIATVLGIASLEACGVSGVCLANASIGILALAPLSLKLFFESYFIYIFLFSILTQLFSIYYMGCFKSTEKLVLRI